MNKKQLSFLPVILLIGLLVWGYMISFHPSKGKEQTENECGLKDTILLVDMSDHVYKMGTSITPREYVDTIITPDAEIKIYHGWNGLTEKWDPYVRYTKSTPDLPDRKKQGDKTCGTQTFLYERYDLTTQTWVGDLKMETETTWAWQDDRYVREQQNTTKSLWSKELQQWIDTFYINTKYCGYWHEAVCNGTMYEIDTTSGEKKTLFSYYQEDHGKVYPTHFYILWNTQTNTPEAMYKIVNEVHHERMLYVWDYLNLNKEWVLLNGNQKEVKRVDSMLNTMMSEMYIDPKMVLFTRYLENLNYSYRNLLGL